MADIFGVKNHGPVTYKEVFKGKEISIEPGETISMNRNDAVNFCGTRPPGGIQLDGMGQLKTESIKALEVIRHEPKEQRIWVSPRNGERFLTEASMLEADAKYNTPQVDESANGHACPICSNEFDSETSVLTHIGKEHADDTSRNIKPSPVSI